MRYIRERPAPMCVYELPCAFHPHLPSACLHAPTNTFCLYVAPPCVTSANVQRLCASTSYLVRSTRICPAPTCAYEYILPLRGTSMRYIRERPAPMCIYELPCALHPHLPSAYMRLRIIIYGYAAPVPTHIYVDLCDTLFETSPRQIALWLTL
ncbi:hypothetical protein R3P38DRAFT_3245485 [Favolaschia claudopus]|uniref:Uncharacterized protein n=1 Tax=Favolaschia claudopus TaxID=2862362 RepID=A0AAV9Z096_9AGAR